MDNRDMLFLLGIHHNAESESESDVDSDNSEDIPNIGARNRQLRIRREQMRRDFNPFDLFNCPDAYFRRHYRMSQELATRLLNLIINQFDISQRDSHIPVHLEFCIALRMYATGGYQMLVGHDFFNPACQSVVSRIMDRFTNCMLNLADQFIRFPESREERQEIQTGFLRFTRIPGILGLIDGTVIKFLRPTQNEEAFYNHHHGHSMNVQLISDHNFLIRNVRICPGSNTDQNVWNHSDAKEFMESLRGNMNILINECPYYLIGDNGYSPSPVMLTPIRNTVPGTPEAFFTREICTTRSREERLHEKLVNKWRILKRERAMRYSPIKTARIILVTTILHNYLILDGNIENREINEQQQYVQDANIAFNNNAGIAERAYIIQRYFAL